MGDEMSKEEQFYMYCYRKSDNKKHRGIEFSGSTEEAVVEMARKVLDQDICEIRVTDLSDHMCVHWTETEGIKHPIEIKDHPDFRPRVQSKSIREVIGEALGKVKGKCLCGSTKLAPSDFKSDLSRKEFQISGLCQKCQDGIWK